MKVGSVPRSFIAITGVMSAETNLALLEACQEAGVDPKDTPQVQKIWERIKKAAGKAHDKKRFDAQKLRQASKKAYKAAQEIETTFPMVRKRS